MSMESNLLKKNLHMITLSTAIRSCGRRSELFTEAPHPNAGLPLHAVIAITVTFYGQVCGRTLWAFGSGVPVPATWRLGRGNGEINIC